jgi:invasion protein IalB
MTRWFRRANHVVLALVLAAIAQAFPTDSSLAATPERGGPLVFAQAAPVIPAEKPEPPAAKEGEEPPEPANLVAEKKSPETNWSAKCVNSADGALVDCRVTQNIALTKTGQRLLAVVVRIPRETGSPVMTLNLPHGLYLPAGTTLQIDKTDPREIVIETCDSKGCYATLDVDEELLVSLKKGSTLTVTFQNLAKQPIAVPVTLIGFTAAYAKIR